jgi:uncharacterized iron-regulated membrane protein
MLISSFTGIYLWWPSRSRLIFRPSFALARNLHYTCSFWGSIVLATLSFTGIFLAFPDAGGSVVAAFAAVSPSPCGIQASEGSADDDHGPSPLATLARAPRPLSGCRRRCIRRRFLNC